MKQRVEVIELDASVVGGEAPVDGADGGVALGDPGRDLQFGRLTVRQSAAEALTSQDAQSMRVRRSLTMTSRQPRSGSQTM